MSTSPFWGVFHCEMPISELMYLAVCLNYLLPAIIYFINKQFARGGIYFSFYGLIVGKTTTIMLIFLIQYPISLHQNKTLRFIALNEGDLKEIEFIF